MNALQYATAGGDVQTLDILLGAGLTQSAQSIISKVNVEFNLISGAKVVLGLKN
jgi:hypothetical protein